MSNLYAFASDRIGSHRPHNTGTLLGREGAAGMKRRTRVYVSGPMLGSGNPYANIERGLNAAMALFDRGYAPYIPHLNAIMEMTKGLRGRDEWLELDKSFVLACDCLLRLDGVSPGADMEVAWAVAAGIPVHGSLDMVFCCEEPTR